MWPNAKEMMLLLRTPDGTKNETRFEPSVTVIESEFVWRASLAPGNSGRGTLEV